MICMKFLPPIKHGEEGVAFFFICDIQTFY